MSGTNTPEYAAARKAWADANLAPLWESDVSHRAGDGPEPPAHWRWQDVRPMLDQAIKLVSPADVERRVLNFSNPNAPKVGGRAPTTRIVSAGLQVLLPGETARPHRHSIDAIRFVMEGRGAVTVVDGKECAMSEGDLILTPGWTWHEHVHRGGAPIIWLDVLNGSLHRYLGTAEFEKGPPNKMPSVLSDAVYSAAAVLPETGLAPGKHSPLFRYSYEVVVAALEAAPPSRDGARRVRYTNPLTGGPAIPLFDMTLVEFAPQQRTKPVRTSASVVCAVVEGQGESTIGASKVAWGARDVFTLPAGNWISHQAAGTARLFMVSDREVFRRLDLLEEELQE